jgi:HPr kinase/phosphorylase
MIVHATTVAVDEAGLMISGPSGSGKSALAIRMLALGAQLVSDDRTVLSRPDEGAPVAEAPEAIRGLIEARGLGLVPVGPAGPTRLAAVLEMSIVAQERLPPDRSTDVLGFAIPLLHRVDAPWFADALVLWLRAVRAR